MKNENVFRLYWYFVSERHAMLERRLAGKPREEWTVDPNLLKYRFTNPYRIEDYVSQDLLLRVLYSRAEGVMTARQPHTPEDVFYRVLLYKFFNKPETWTTLVQYGCSQWEHVRDDMGGVDKVLTTAKATGAIYSAAYVIPAAPSTSKQSKHYTHLELL